MMQKNLKQILTAGAMLLAVPVLAIPTIGAIVNNKTKVTPQVSVGHNLDAPARLKTPGNGLTVTPKADRQKAQQRLAADESALLFEGFETCEYKSYTMPEGWESLSKGETAGNGEDHWLGLSKDYTDFFQFAPPAEGKMMVGVFYNDDINKDEWLISPTVKIEGKDYDLSFYWYTVPMYLYVIDRFHVDFANKKFTDREIAFNFEVLAREEGSEDWTSIFNLESLFADKEYSELENIDYYEMQHAAVSLDDYEGKTVQFAFRYYGQAGNTLTLDAVSVDMLKPDIAYTPYYSRLFYGFDEEIWWMPASIEFYPVNYPNYWFNESNDTKGVEFGWTYSDLDAEGNLVWVDDDSDPDMLAVTYHPDYTSEETLMNNFYYLPQLRGRGPQGGVATFTDEYDFLQAGGTTEFGSGSEYTKYYATNFDIIHEGLCIHAEDNDEHGFYQEPIFGRSVNTDEWWVNYCFPDRESEDRYAYVDGFANLYLPHPEAPLVVKGVSAACDGDIYDDAEFFCTIYSMTEEGYIIEKPVVRTSIRGSEVTKFSDGMTRDYLLLNFKFDEPVIFSTEGTGYGYMVEISGYHDEKIRYFAPLQSADPNKHEWAFGFYRLYSSFDEMYDRDITEQFGYLAFFRDDFGRDLYSSFAIGLDAHYPWLDLDEESMTVEDGKTMFNLLGYYAADEYTVEAPEMLDVTLSGRYTTQVVAKPVGAVAEDCEVPVKISAPGVELSVNVPVKSTSAVSTIEDAAEVDASVYTLDGKKLTADPASLPAGLYIIGGRKVIK